MEKIGNILNRLHPYENYMAAQLVKPYLQYLTKLAMMGIEEESS
jgi:hypothetical protein